MKAYVNTMISQEIEVPEGTTKQDILNFLAEHQSFNDAFAGVSDPEQTMRITGITVIDESIDSIGEESYDA